MSMEHGLPPAALPVEPHYRPMTLEDVEQVAEIDRCSFTLPWPPRSFVSEVRSNPFSRCWVAEIAPPQAPAALVGMVVTWMVVDEGHIATIAVSPEYRGQGIGRRLLEVAMQDAREQGMLSMTLEVRASNQVARQMYRQAGFEDVGLRPHYYQDNQEDAIIMTRNFV